MIFVSSLSIDEHGRGKLYCSTLDWPVNSTLSLEIKPNQHISIQLSGITHFANKECLRNSLSLSLSQNSVLCKAILLSKLIISFCNMIRQPFWCSAINNTYLVVGSRISWIIIWNEITVQNKCSNYNIFLHHYELIVHDKSIWNVYFLHNMWSDTSVFWNFDLFTWCCPDTNKFALLIENDALVLLYINEIQKNIKKDPGNTCNGWARNREKWPFYMNGVCVCGLWTQNFWCCYQWSRRGIWCEHQMCML